MNNKNTRYLLENFSELYKGFYKSYKDTAMCWGFECGDGWFELIKNLSKELYAYTEKTGAELPEVMQVKEKYGTLRYYIMFGTKEQYKIIDKWCDLSETTCEETGEPGKLRVKRGWYKTLSDKMSKELDYNDIKEDFREDDKVEDEEEC